MEAPYHYAQKIEKHKIKITQILNKRREKRATLYYIFNKMNVSNIKLCKSILDKMISEGSIRTRHISKEEVYLLN